MVFVSVVFKYTSILRKLLQLRKTLEVCCVR